MPKKINVTIASNPGYKQVHKWLFKTYGKADLCEGENCKGISKKYHWALIKGKAYAKERTHFKKLCCSCHKAYDIKPEHIEAMRKGVRGKPAHNIRPVDQFDLENNFIQSFPSLEVAQKETKILKTAILNNINGLSTKAGGFVWKPKP